MPERRVGNSLAYFLTRGTCEPGPVAIQKRKANNSPPSKTTSRVGDSDCLRPGIHSARGSTTPRLRETEESKRIEASEPGPTSLVGRGEYPMCNVTGSSASMYEGWCTSSIELFEDQVFSSL